MNHSLYSDTPSPASNLPVSRRQALQRGLGYVAAGLALPYLGEAASLGGGEEWVPFSEMPPTPPNRLDWEMLDQWLTPQDQVFSVQHYGSPQIDLDSFKLDITGLVKQPRSLSLQDLHALPTEDRFMTLECSGNGASKGFMNAIYNSRWTGVPLGPLVESCGLDPKATEIVFYGADTKEEVLRPGTKNELKVDVPFGRSMALEEAMNGRPLLAYRRNGEDLEDRNGAPLRLIVPGWYGVANVKWLTRIELRDQRYMGRYMARDYVTVRGQRDGEAVHFTETSVARMNLKSVVARVTRQATSDGKIPLKVFGAAWGDGTPMDRVEVRLDEGPWREATWDTTTPQHPYCWRFFEINLPAVSPGRHTLVSRVFDAQGRMQPAAEDDEIALKKTYWEAYQQWPRLIDLEA